MQRQKSGLKDDNDEVSQLIWCVRQRPALYNYKLSPQNRRRVDVAKGWQDVADEIGGRVTAEECRKKWKNLRDTYHQYRLRKSKFKDCLEKWRYSKDLAFLADIYQPKLKSERSRYTKECASLNNTVDNIDKVKTSSIIYQDESEFQKINDDETMSENDYGGSLEHVVEVDEVQFCDVNTTKVTDEVYEEVCLYEEGETNVISVSSVEESHDEEEKYEIDNEDTSMKYIESADVACPERVHLTIGNNKDELDLFFQFLKTKIEKLPPVDITAIQIEFLNAVLKKEYANTINS